jgi:hypothetical protein
MAYSPEWAWRIGSSFLGRSASEFFEALDKNWLEEGSPLGLAYYLQLTYAALAMCCVHGLLLLVGVLCSRNDYVPQVKDFHFIDRRCAGRTATGRSRYR